MSNARKVVIHRAGGYEQLKLEEFTPEPPGPGEVAVSTRAVGVNYADCIIRMGLYQSAKDYVGWPITPGFEFSGEVSALGVGVTDLKVGDKVFGVMRFGGYSTEVVAPRNQIFRLGHGLGFNEAAGLPAIFLSAYFPLVEMIRLKPGMKVLIHSAAGGVGSSMVQIAAASGAEVTGVVGSSHKVDAVKALGATHVIDKSKGDLWEQASRAAPKGFDVVADANGVETLGQSFKHLAPAGRLVIYGFHTMLPRAGKRVNWLKLAYDYLRTPRFNPIQLTNDNKSILCFNLSYLFDQAGFLQEGMDYVLSRLDEKKLRLPRITPYALSDVAKAQEALESGKTVGKLVLTTTSTS